MLNPFVNRSIEQIRDEAGFLSVVTPAPLREYLGEAAGDGRLYRMLVQIFGPPGSGKTTIARLFEFPIISALLRRLDQDGYKETLKVLIACGAIDEDDHPRILGYRLGLEGQYRQIWELPYSEELRTGLLQTLIQARAVQGWFRALHAAEIDLGAVRVKAKAGGEAVLASIGGETARAVLDRSIQVEQAVYAITAAIEPPEAVDLDLSGIRAYHPFDIIERVDVPWRSALVSVQPLLILDDTSKLHHDQYRLLERWLVRREIRIARWMLGWGDRLPFEVLTGSYSPSGEEHPGLTPGRDRLMISLRDGLVGGDRSDTRRRFRHLMPQIADRYLARMEVFAERRITTLETLLPRERNDPTQDVVVGLRHKLDVEARAARVSATVVDGLRAQVEAYARGAETPLKEDEALEMTRILLHRFLRRNPQRILFPVDEDESETQLRVGAPVAEGARVHLLEEYGRPLYYGLESLCDAASMNIEQFLFLCTPLVDEAETRLIRGRRTCSIDVARQNDILRDRARQALDSHWRFPHSGAVLRFAAEVARLCRERSLQRNAPLGPGANALGVPQDEFDRLVKDDADVKRVLHAGLAHNALSLVRDHDCKKRKWVLLQLNGMLILRHGLSLRWGGFVEARATDIPVFLAGGGP